MLEPVILQGQGPNVDSFVVFLAICLLVFPVLFFRSILKGWRPASTGGLFWKALLIFSSPFYVGVVVVKIMGATGLVSEEFGQLFPSLQNPGGKLPDVPEGVVNFWSEFTVGLMSAALLSGLAAVLIHAIFKDRQKAGRKFSGIVFWAALYASAIVIANGVFDRVREVSLAGQAKQEAERTLLRQSTKEKRQSISVELYKLGEASSRGANNSFDQRFRAEKEASEAALGAQAEELPDTVIERFFRLANHQVRTLAGADPMACYYFFHTGTYLRRFQDVFKETGQDPETRAILANLEQELRDPSLGRVSPAMAREAFEAKTKALYDEVRQSIPAEDQNFNIFRNPQQVVTPEQKTKGCLTYLAYMDQLSKLPPEDSLQYYRRLLKERGDAINAVDLLRPAPKLLALYDELVPEGAALSILFHDNPLLKRDFVFYLIENFKGDIERVRGMAEGRKKELLDVNLPYYFYLASDGALFGHVTYHATFLEALGAGNALLCGRMGGVLETTSLAAISTRPYANHERAVASVMISSRTNPDQSPDVLSGDDLDQALADVKTEMRRILRGERPDLDLLLDEAQRQTPAELVKACRQSQAFYSALGRWPGNRRAAFLRALLAEKTQL